MYFEINDSWGSRYLRVSQKTWEHFPVLFVHCSEHGWNWLVSTLHYKCFPMHRPQYFDDNLPFLSSFMVLYRNVLAKIFQSWRIFQYDTNSKSTMKIKYIFNQFLANILILYPIKTPENIWFSDIFKGYEIWARDGLTFDLNTKRWLYFISIWPCYWLILVLPKIGKKSSTRILKKDPENVIKKPYRTT